MNDTLDSELKEIEAQLANLSPNHMPGDMLARMEQAMISWETHLPLEEKIVPFNSIDPSSASKKANLNAWGAAAAIALMTSLTAVFMASDTNSQEPAEIAVTAPTPSSKILATSSPTNSALPELSRNITHASNEGITYAGKNEAPFKVLRIEYTEKVTTFDKDGKPVVTDKPYVEHVLVPVPVH